MFDYRYHALSLAAVLLALMIGVLLGVAIGDSNLVSSAKNGIVADMSLDGKPSSGMRVPAIWFPLASVSGALRKVVDGS